MKKSLSIALLFLVAFGPLARGQNPPPAQQPQETDDVLRISTELVQTDVRVFDKSGRFVEGLQREQFEVKVDGQAVPVSFMERVVAGSTREAMLEDGAVPRAAAAKETAPAVADRGRTIIFFLDDLHLSAESVRRTRASILRFIDNEMGLNDLVAIGSPSGQIGFLQQFTDNKAVLRAAVARINHRPYIIRDNEQVPLTEYTALKIDQGDRDAIDYYTTQLLQMSNFSSVGGTPGPPPGGPNSGGRAAQPRRGTTGMTRESAEKVVRERAQVMLKQAAAVTIGTLTTLESLMRSSAALPGRKLIFFVSDGFYLNDRNTGFGDKLKRITDAAVRGGSIIYTLDARGLVGDTDASSNKADPMGRLARANIGELSASQDALTALAGDTGGRALLNNGDLSRVVTDALKETSNYYLLAWKPTDNQRGGKFKRIEVSIAGRPDLTVKLPRGYLDADAATLAAVREEGKSTKPAEAPAKTADAELRTAMLNSFAPRKSVPTQLSVSYLDAPNSGGLLTASVQVSTARLNYGADGKQPAEVDVAGVVLNDQGKPTASFKTRLSVKPLPPGVTQTEQASVVYSYKAPVTPGLYQVRAAARDDKSGLVGSAQQWIEIPDLTGKKLTLSTLLIGGQLLDKASAAGGAGAPAQDANTGAQMQFSVDKRFARASRLNFWVFIYNALRAGGNAQPDVTAQVQIFRGTQAIVTTPHRKLITEGAEDPARLLYTGGFALNSLAPGRYTLQVTITDKAANSSATQRTFFEVE